VKKLLASSSGPVQEKHHDSCRHQAKTRIRERNDIVVMPNFLWRHHVNTGKTEHRPVPRPGQGPGRQRGPADRLKNPAGATAGAAYGRRPSRMPALRAGAHILIEINGPSDVCRSVFVVA
jgi:hypothetical protein